jgi:hypothetical protein
MPATADQLLAQRLATDAAYRSREAQAARSAAAAMAPGPERDAALAAGAAARTAARDTMLEAQRRVIVGGLGLELLDRTLPVLLLPVRLEARIAWPNPATDPRTPWVFGDPGAAAVRRLLVRIVPDVIHLDDFERGLTEQEAEAGRRFSTAARGASHAGVLEAWRELAADVGPDRALWVARQDSAHAQRRPQGWSTQGVARLLPDRWEVSVRVAGAGGTSTARAVGAVVPDPVALTLDPLAPDASDLAWVESFTAAQAIGLGVPVPLTDPSGQPLTGSVDRVIALGAVGRLNAEAAQAAFVDLLDAHHMVAGVRVGRVGDPTTSSTVGRAVTGQRPELSPEHIEAERQRGENPSEQAPHDRNQTSDRLARALGTSRLPWRVLPGALTSAIATEADLRAVAVAAFRPVLSELLDTPALQLALESYEERLSATGPLPTLVVRDQPYGLVPVLPLIDEPQTDPIMETVERVRRAWWEPAVERVPRLGRLGRDSLADLVAVLGRDAGPHTFGMRVGVLGDLSASVAREREITDASGPLADAFGQGTNAPGPDWATRLLEVLMHRGAAPLSAPLTVTDLREDGGPLIVPESYLPALAAAPLRDVLLGAPGIPVGAPAPLLYQLARAALLAVLDAAVRDAIAAAGTLDPASLPGWTTPLSDDVSESVWAVAERSGVGVSASETALDLLERAPTPALAALRARIDLLGRQLPLTELEAMTRQVLGLATRIDPWYSAAAWDRLDELRASTDAALPGRRGLQIGGFGVLERFLPADSPGAAGPTFVHAPGAAHAVTAAVLHSAHRQRQRDALGLSAADAAEVTATAAVRLDSDATRGALDLLDALRAGQPLAELLGADLEQRLVARGRQTLLPPLRATYPTAQGPRAPGAVVDGLAAVRAAGFPGPLTTPLPISAGPGASDLSAALDAVAASLDALGDLLLADGVHQLVQGRFARAAALTDFAAGARGSVPEPHVPQTDRLADAQQVRVIVVLPSGVDTTTTWPVTARSTSAPALAAWAEKMLPAPADVALWCDLPEHDSEPTEARIVSLGDLLGGEEDNPVPHDYPAAFGPLDVLAAGDASAQPGTALRARLDDLAGRRAGRPAQIDPERVATGDSRTLPWSALTEAASRLSRLLGSARPLEPADIGRDPAALLPEAVDDLIERAQAAASALASVAADLAALDLEAADADALRVLLFMADLAGVPVAVPEDDPSLRVAASAARAEAARRHAALPAALASTATHPERIRWSRDVLEGVFGAGTPAILDLARPSLGTASTVARAWLAQAASVRTPVRRLLLTDLLAAAGGHAGTVHAVRLPDGEWAPTPGPPGTLDLVALAPLDGASSGDRLAGLAVDEWTQTVPAAQTDTAITFHRPSPSASPPQCMLLAVPPASLEAWTADALERSMVEALHLSRLRAVELADLGPNQLLSPMLSASEPLGARREGLPVDGLAPDGLIGSAVS